MGFTNKSLYDSIVNCECEVKMQYKDTEIMILGTGYVGLVMGVCLSKVGYTNIHCVDIDDAKINKLKNGISPIYEKDLDTILQKGIKNNSLRFSSDVSTSIQKAEIIIVAVGTPQEEKTGYTDFTSLNSAVEAIFTNSNTHKPPLVILKSTVPVGTCQNIQKKLATKNIKFAFNPEFLREGNAVYDLLNPDRIIIGTSDQETQKVIMEFYQPFCQANTKLYSMSIESAEVVKHAANSFLAMKLTFFNELSYLCEKSNADIDSVIEGVTDDERIGTQFTKVGPGYGGSCFPKDTKSLSYISKKLDAEMSLITQTIKANELHKKRIINKILSIISTIDKKNVSISLLGLAFKSGTDDIKHSLAIDIAEQLQKMELEIFCYDPTAENNFKQLFKDLQYTQSLQEALSKDFVIIITELDEIKLLKPSDFDNKKTIIYDTRNCINKKEFEKSELKYTFIGDYKKI